MQGIRKPPENYRKERKTVDVPDRSKKKGGFFSKLVNVIPFVGDDEPKRIEKSDENDDTFKEDEEETSVSSDDSEEEAAATP